MRRTVAVAVALAALWSPADAAGAWTWPARGEVVTSYDYGGTSPYAGGQHRGVDIAATPGTPVVAAAGGTVRFVGSVGDAGLTVSVRTADGRLDTSYLHLSAVAIRAGQAVAAGDRIGAAGTTGSPSSGTPHVHFGVRRAGTEHGYRDPLRFLPPQGAPRDGPRGVPVAAPAPIRVAPRTAPVPRLHPVAVPAPAPIRVAPRTARVPRLHPVAVPATGPAPAPAPAAGGLDPGQAIAVAAVLAAALLGSSRPAASRRVRVALRLRPSAQGAE